jgi:hypothetical protein
MKSWILPSILFGMTSAFAETPVLSPLEILLPDGQSQSVSRSIERIRSSQSRDGSRQWGSYFSERVKVLVGDDFEAWENLRSPVGKHLVSRTEQSLLHHDSKAQNLSILWLYRILNLSEFPEVKLHLGNKEADISLDNPNVGVVQLKSSFNKLKFEVQRMGILIHEARHSDCDAGLEEDVLAKLQQSTSEEESSAALSQSSCTFPHSICPEGHDFEGLPLCEAQVWGPNAVEMKFYKDFVDSCKDCTEQDKMSAKILGLAAAERILNLEDLYTGEWPKLEFSKKVE